MRWMRTATRGVSVFLEGGYNCQYSENEQKLNHQCGRKCKIIDKGEESVGEVGTDDEIDVIILRMNLLNY